MLNLLLCMRAKCSYVIYASQALSFPPATNVDCIVFGMHLNILLSLLIISALGMFSVMPFLLSSHLVVPFTFALY